MKIWSVLGSEKDRFYTGWKSATGSPGNLCTCNSSVGLFPPVPNLPQTATARCKPLPVGNCSFQDGTDPLGASRNGSPFCYGCWNYPTLLCTLIRSSEQLSFPGLLALWIFIRRGLDGLRVYLKYN